MYFFYLSVVIVIITLVMIFTYNSIKFLSGALVGTIKSNVDVFYDNFVEKHYKLFFIYFQESNEKNKLSLEEFPQKFSEYFPDLSEYHKNTFISIYERMTENLVLLNEDINNENARNNYLETVDSLGFLFATNKETYNEAEVEKYKGLFINPRDPLTVMELCENINKMIESFGDASLTFETF
jgi:hypothetical protein